MLSRVRNQIPGAPVNRARGMASHRGDDRSINRPRNIKTGIDGIGTAQEERPCIHKPGAEVGRIELAVLELR